MGVFEDFIQDELPLRQVVVKAAGNPTTGDGYIAAIGTYYLDTDDSFKRYEKVGSGNTDWRATPTTSSSGAVETEILLLADESTVYITQYGVLGDADLISFTADVVSNTVALSGTSLESLEVSIYKFLLS